MNRFAIHIAIGVPEKRIELWRDFSTMSDFENSSPVYTLSKELYAIFNNYDNGSRQRVLKGLLDMQQREQEYVV